MLSIKAEQFDCYLLVVLSLHVFNRLFEIYDDALMKTIHIYYSTQRINTGNIQYTIVPSTEID